MFSFLTGSQNIEFYLLVIFLLLSALPLDSTFVNMWLVLFIFTGVTFVTGNRLSHPDLVFFSNPKDFMYDPDYNTWKSKNAPDY